MDSLRPYTLLDYLRLARRHKLTVAVPAAIFVFASVIAIWQLPNVYESTTFIIVDAQGGATSDRPPIDIGRRLTTIRQQVTTRSGLEELIEEYGLYRKMQERGEPADNIVAAMRSDIVIDISTVRPDATDAFAISYRAPDPETARAVTMALANRLIADNTGAVQSGAAAEVQALAVRSDGLSGVVPRDTSSARLAQEYIGLKQSYKEAAARLQKARLEARVIERSKVDRFRVVDKANLPEVPVWPNRRLLVLIATLIGLGLGIVSFLCLTLRELTSMRDATDVSYYTSLPLLAVVPRIATPAEQARHARRRRIRLLVGAVACAITAFGLSKVLIVAHLFEVVVRR